MKKRASLAMLLVCSLASLTHAQSCSSGYSSSYTQVYRPTYSYGRAYSTPSYQSHSYSYKETKHDYEPYLFRFILAFPVADLPSYGAAYQAPPVSPSPTPPTPTPQPNPNQPLPFQSKGNQSSEMQQLLQAQQQILTEIQSLKADVKKLDERVVKIERTRGAIPQPKDKGGAPLLKEEPTDDKIDADFAAANLASCAACHSRSNAAKYGSSFVLSEDDGRINPSLTPEQREEVDRQIQSGDMPMLKSKRAQEAGVKPLTQESANALFRGLDKQKKVARNKKEK